jgi:hypothetical protein
MHAEARAIADPIEQATKFVEIQVEDDRLDAMDEVNRAAKTTLRQFRPTVQDEYILLQQLDSLADTEWNALLATKPEVPDVNACAGICCRHLDFGKEMAGSGHTMTVL